MKKLKFEKILIAIEQYLPLVLMCTFIFIQSSRRAVAVSYIGWFNYFLHKFAHVIVFSFLFLFACRAFKDKKLALIFTILYAVSDEYHQSFVVTRTSAFSDVLIDTIAGSGIFYLSEKYQKKIPLVIRNFFHI